MQKNYKILLTGGGTGGSVTPLLAIHEDLTSQPPLLIFTPSSDSGRRGEEEVRYEFLWLGTKDGPEKEMVEQVGIKFKAISGGKWRRYFSLHNFADIFKIKLGFWQSFFIILKWRPDLVISAGSFVSVPVIWSAWLFKAPIIIHQQDVKAGLANKLMAPLANVVTVTFEQSLKNYGKKAVWTGNPIRQSLKTKNQKPKTKNFINLNSDLPIVLVLGGGTGALAINQLVEQSLDELTKFCQVILVSCKNKGGKGGSTSNLEVEPPIKPPINFRSFEFLNTEQMAEALNLADIVVTRAGMSFLTELSYLGKPAIIIPLPDSHQEDNARIFKNAAIVLKQGNLNSRDFVDEIKKLIQDKNSQKKLSENIGNIMRQKANQQIVTVIYKILTKA